MTRRWFRAVWPSRPPSNSWYVQVTTALSNIQSSVDRMHGKVNQILMSEQQIASDVAAISTMMDDVSAKAADLTAAAQSIAAQAAAGTTVDTTQLDALAARAQQVQSALDAASGSVSALVQQPAAPADPNAPVDPNAPPA